MANSIAYRTNFVDVIDEVYQRESVSRVLLSPRSAAKMGSHAREIKIPKISTTGLGDYKRDVGYPQGSINYGFETREFNYERAVRLTADVMDVEESGVIDCFMAAAAELQRSHVAPEADAFTFAEIAGFEGVGRSTDDFSSASAVDVLAKLRDVTSVMDEAQVTAGSRYLFITPTLRGIVDDYSYANPSRSNRVLERFAKIVEVPQTRFYDRIDLLPGDDDQFGYRRAAAVYELTGDVAIDEGKTYYARNAETGAYSPVASPGVADIATYYEQVQGEGSALNFLVVEKSAVLKFYKHVVSRIFDPDELENLDSYLLKYRLYGLVSVLERKVSGVFASVSAA